MAEAATRRRPQTRPSTGPSSDGRGRRQRAECVTRAGGREHPIGHAHASLRFMFVHQRLSDRCSGRETPRRSRCGVAQCRRVVRVSVLIRRARAPYMQRVIRIADNDLVSQSLKALCDPFGFRAGLESECASPYDHQTWSRTWYLVVSMRGRREPSRLHRQSESGFGEVCGSIAAYSFVGGSSQRLERVA